MRTRGLNITQIMLLTLTLATLLLLTGCGEGKMRELDELELVRVLALDCTETGGVRVTAEGGGLDGDRTMLTAEAVTISSALQEVQWLSEKYLFYGHTEDILMSVAAADRLEVYQDYLARDSSMRLGMKLYIIGDGDAGDALRGCAAPDGVESFLAEVEEDLKLSSEGCAYSLGDVISGIAERGAASAQMLRLAEGGNDGDVLVPAGLAILTEKGIAGYIDSDTAQGVNLVTGNFHEAHAEIETDGGVTVGIAMNGAAAKIEVVWENGMPEELVLRCEIQASVEELQGEVDLRNEKEVHRLELLLEERECGLITAAVECSRELQADFMGIWDMVNMKYPLRTAESGVGRGELLKLPIRVEVTAEIERSSDLTQPLSNETEDG